MKIAIYLLSATLWLMTLSLLSAEEETRTWTNLEGRQIQAQLLEVIGDKVTLKMSAQNYQVPINTLSETDQEYIKDYQARIAEKKKQLEEAAKAAAKKIKRGVFEIKLSKKMFADPDDYYNTAIGKAARKAIKKEGKDPIAHVNLSPDKEKAKVFVPQHYDGTQAFSFYFHISPGAKPNLPTNYKPILKERNMIMASAAKGGNKEPLMRRLTLALDTLATLKTQYKIDDSRVYIGGFSGGGISAMTAQLIYPDIWQGALSHARGMNVGNFGEYYTEVEYFGKKEFKRASRMKQRFAILSGPGDFNHEHCRNSAKQWKKHGFNVKFYDIPSMKHANAPPASFEEALDWVMGKR